MYRNRRTASLRITAALSCLGAVFALSFATLVWGGSAESVEFNLPAQSLEASLRSIADRQKLQIVYVRADLEGIAAPALKGHYSAVEAIAKLTEGTKLTASFDGKDTVVIKPKAGAQQRAGARDEERDGIRLTQSAAAASGSGAAGQEARRNQNIPDSAAHGPKVDEIIVTAQKRAERLQDVPIPVTALKAEALTGSNQLRLQDYYTRIPGLNLVANADGGPMIAMRGIITGGQTASTVGIVVDEVPYGGSTNTGTSARPPDIDPGDLARVEVLRGPQGTLYGASSIGGLLKFVPVDPSTEAVSGRMQAGTETVNEGELGYSLRGSVNLPLGETVALRASGFTVREPGYVDNIQTGADDVNRRESDGGRVAALWRPSENFSLKLSAMVQDSQRRGPVEVDRALGGPLEVRALEGTGLYGRRTQVYSAIAAGKLGRIDLTSVSGYNIDHFSNRGDLSVSLGALLASPNFGVSGVAAPFFQRAKKFTQELRASIPLGERVNWLLGAFYADERLKTHLDYLAADAATGATAGTLMTVDQPTAFEEYALFTNVTIDVTDRFDVQVGGRASENRQSFSGLRTGPGAVVFYGSNPSILPESRFKDSPVTYLLTPRFRISPDLMAYVRLASGYRAGGPNANCGLTVPCQYDADTTQDYEIGMKGNVLERVLSFDLSVYRIDWDDVQINLRNPAGTVVYAANAGRAKSDGVELSLESRPLQGLLLSTVASWSAAKLAHDLPASSPVAGLRGDRLPYSSPFSGNFSIDQEFPIGGAVTGFVGGSVGYVGARKGLFRSAAQVRVTYPSYTQVDLRMGVRFDSWSINAYVNNVADERGILNGGLDANRPTFYTYIQPRTLGVSLGKDF